MVDSEHEDTLSISLVDGITCGLASTLLLVIIFGMNLATPTIDLGGSGGRGTFGNIPTDLPGEPVDIIVEIKSSPDDVDLPSSGFREPSDDRRMVDSEGRRTVFLRQLPQGFSTLEQARVRADVGFRLKWNGPAPAEGWIHIFRAGAHQKFRFECPYDRKDVNLIQDFDLRQGRLIGDCT